jgi:L-fuconolactonase
MSLNMRCNIEYLVLKENVIELSKKEKMICGIVGWTDLKSENVEANLKRLKNMSNGKLVGIRHLTQYENFNWVWQDEVQRGLKCMEEMGLVYDLSFDPQCLKHAPKLATKFPKMTFVIDHMAKPEGKNFVRNEWFEDLKNASKYPNVYCKL